MGFWHDHGVVDFNGSFEHGRYGYEYMILIIMLDETEHMFYNGIEHMF